MSRATDAYQALIDAMQSCDPACQEDGRFILDDQSAHSLAPLCHACPLFALCRTYADLDKPKGGIWAGKRFKTYKTRDNEGDAPE